jgi:hypothetical protein
VVVMENKGGMRALRRCRELAAGNLWRLFFLGLGIAIVSTLVGIVMVALIGLVYEMTGAPGELPVHELDPRARLLQAGAALVAGALQAAWSPVFPIAQLLAYLDLRIRRENYDLELLTSGVEARVAARVDAPVPGAIPDQPNG